jgi:DNA modification methylase
MPEVWEDTPGGGRRQTMNCTCGHCGHKFEAQPTGGHRVACGDSTSAEDVKRLMRGELADFVFTSPPYAQQRDYESAIGDWDALMQGVFSILPVTDNAQVLINLGLVHRDNEWIPYWSAWIDWMRAAGWRRFGLYVWDQGFALPGDWNGRLGPSFEFIFHFNRASSKTKKSVAKKPGSVHKGHGTGLRKADGKMSAITNRAASLQPNKIHDNVFRVTRHMARGGVENRHPALFPVALVEEVAACYTKEGDVLFDPFCGAGTVIIACEKTGRVARGMEIAAAYVDIAVLRWQNFTGQSAILESTFEPFGAAR